MIFSEHTTVHIKNINSEKTTNLPIFNESIWSNPTQSVEVLDKISSTIFHEAFNDLRTNTLTELSTNAEFKSFLDKGKNNIYFISAELTRYTSDVLRI